MDLVGPHEVGELEVEHHLLPRAPPSAVPPALAASPAAPQPSRRAPPRRAPRPALHPIRASAAPRRRAGAPSPPPSGPPSAPPAAPASAASSSRSWTSLGAVPHHPPRRLSARSPRRWPSQRAAAAGAEPVGSTRVLVTLVGTISDRFTRTRFITEVTNFFTSRKLQPRLILRPSPYMPNRSSPTSV
jgi:hypothetical protein